MSRSTNHAARRRPPQARADMGDLFRALHFAAEQHRDHRRKGQTAAPYINHPITVAEQLAAEGLADDLELLMAAVLHDVIEDTETTPEELERLFGGRVTRIVLEVTDDKSLRWEERKAIVVRELPGKSHEARLLKVSDLIANIHDVIHHPPNWSAERKLRYLDWAGQVVRGIRGVHAGLERRFDDLVAQARAALGDE